jgi:D-alanyl-D-alanine carboxypeptidase
VPGAHFRAASVTKQLTAVLALQLVERGTWSLETTIGDVLPGLWPEHSDVTLRQLMSHTSGMPDYLPVLLKRATSTRKLVRTISQRRTDRELVRAARKRAWLFEPGTDIRYSNTNFVVVGMMLKKQTGRPMGTLVRRRVLEPSGMTRSRFATDRRLPRPSLHEYAVIGRKRVDLRRFHPSIFSSAGALVTTARDLNRFHAALSRGALVPPGLVRVMRSVIGHDPEAGLAYGLGSYRYGDPCRAGGVVHGHDGATWGTLTLTFTSPDGRRRVTVAMTGRELVPRPRTDQAFYGFLDQALAATCGRVPRTGGAEASPTPRLPSLGLRLGSQTWVERGSLTGDG